MISVMTMEANEEKATPPLGGDGDDIIIPPNPDWRRLLTAMVMLVVVERVRPRLQPGWVMLYTAVRP